MQTSYSARPHFRAALSAIALVCVSFPGIATAEIIWRGDYETGNYLQWHLKANDQHPQLAGVPQYGRPKAPSPFVGTAALSYYGDGQLMSLVTSPVRQGRYANRVTVKDSTASTDYDNGVSSRRRTELNMHLALMPDYGAMQYMNEYWVSASVFLPSDWNTTYGDDAKYLTVFQLKSPATNEVSPTFEISVRPDNRGWRLWHRWSNADNPSSFSVVPWQYQMSYDTDSPTASNWPDGLVDFPDERASRAALADYNLGGWTDWVIHAKWDGRGTDLGGTGFLEVWKRAGSGEWVQVLNIQPKKTTRGGMTFNHGIGYKIPGSGFGPLAGMYIDNSMVVGMGSNRTLYNDNIKIGSYSTKFAEMSPDGSSPDDDAVKPNSPLLEVK